MRFRWGVLAAMVIVIASAYVGLVMFKRSVARYFDPVTDPARYPQILAQLSTAGESTDPAALKGFLPRSIPAGAVNPRLFYRPGFGQGHMELQLRLQLPAAEVAQIATASAASQPTTRPDNVVVMMFRDASNTGWAELPPDFQVYILGFKIRPAEAEPDYVFGIAVSTSRNEVIYWWE